MIDMAVQYMSDNEFRVFIEFEQGSLRILLNKREARHFLEELESVVEEIKEHIDD